jgi:WD40 repeat protein
MRITILNVETRSVVKTIEDTSWTEDAAFSPDGQWLATVGGDASIRLWDTATWRLRFKLKGHSDRVLKVAFSPSGRLLATGSRNGEVKVWAVAEPPRRSESVDISGSRIVDVARDGSAFWRVTEAQPFVREGRKVVRVTAGEMWSAESMTRLGSLKIDDVLFPVPGLAADVSPGGHTFAVGGFDNIVHFRSVDDKEDIAKDEAGKTLLQWMVISLDGSVLASLSYHGNWGIRAWRLPAMEMLGERKDITNAHRICLSDDGKSLAVMTGTGDIGVLALPSLTGPPLWKAVGEVPNWSACAFSPDGRRLATTLSGDTFIWELSTRRRIALARNLAGYSSLSFSPDGTRLLASDGRTARIFDTTTGQQVFSLSEPDAKVAFTRDGQGLLVVSLQRAFMLHAPPLAQLQFNWLSKSGARSSEVRTASDPDRSQHRNTGNTETPNTGDTAGHP